jgi:hypothetical protein
MSIVKRITAAQARRLSQEGLERVRRLEREAAQTREATEAALRRRNRLRHQYSEQIREQRETLIRAACAGASQAIFTREKDEQIFLPVDLVDAGLDIYECGWVPVRELKDEGAYAEALRLKTNEAIDHFNLLIDALGPSVSRQFGGFATFKKHASEVFDTCVNSRKNSFIGEFAQRIDDIRWLKNEICVDRDEPGDDSEDEYDSARLEEGGDAAPTQYESFLESSVYSRNFDSFIIVEYSVKEVGRLRMEREAYLKDVKSAPVEYGNGELCLSTTIINQPSATLSPGSKNNHLSVRWKKISGANFSGDDIVTADGLSWLCSTRGARFLERVYGLVESVCEEGANTLALNFSRIQGSWKLTAKGKRLSACSPTAFVEIIKADAGYEATLEQEGDAIRIGLEW